MITARSSAIGQLRFLDSPLTRPASFDFEFPPAMMVEIMIDAPLIVIRHPSRASSRRPAGRSRLPIQFAGGGASGKLESKRAGRPQSQPRQAARSGQRVSCDHQGLVIAARREGIASSRRKLSRGSRSICRAVQSYTRAAVYRRLPPQPLSNCRKSLSSRSPSASATRDVGVYPDY